MNRLAFVALLVSVFCVSLLARYAGTVTYVPAHMRMVDPPSELYPAVELAHVSGGHWVRPRAELRGKVTYSKVEADGDRHFRLEDGGGAFVVCEIAPELPMEAPKVGDRVIVRGVVRFDGEHKWWELHPVVSVKKDN